MSLRYCYVMLLALVLAGQSGCCGINWGPAGPPCARRWCCSQCGEVFWNEWFSCPPLCRDFCSCCGDFTASDNPYVATGPLEGRYGPIYDDGSRRGSARRESEYYPKRTEPTPAARPAPIEELPAAEPTTRVFTNEFGHTVSYERPIDSPRAYRKLGKPRRGEDFAR